MKKLSKKQVREIKEWVDINVDKLFNVSVEYILNEEDELVLLLKIENDVLQYDGSSEYELSSFDEVKEELEDYIINDKNNKLEKGFKKEACIDWDYHYMINKDIEDDGTFDNYVTVYPMYQDGEYSASFNIDGVQKDLIVSEKEIKKWLKQKGFKYGFVEGQKTLKELDLDIWNQTYNLPGNIAEHKYLVEKFSIFPYLDLYFKKELRDVIEVKKVKNVIKN